MFTSEESQKLLQMEKALQKHIIGQPVAVEAISCAIRRSRVGIGDPDRPIGSFLFTGPTGVGKTELANSLAVEYFGSKEAMIRLDMSEYMEKHSVSRFFGSPPGYLGYDNGGQLTEAVHSRPRSVILFDEIEKAPHDVLNTMLQEGLLRFEQVKAEVEEELKRHFRLEFLNRFDDVIVFKQLSISDLKEIVEIMIKEVLERLKAKNIERAIRRLLEDNLAEWIINGEVKVGDSVTVDIDSMGNVKYLRDQRP
ncbi:hypothetical protein JRO89_XS01G0209900 [Xanthoceras sorbifolium]|uniref:Uncharacterized protein n=1 Tax=Xanthoceras sorbifolium TaxID=99658 RepID=A0ABQ8IL23_9ROSI|nr:hypothetical protein JRO89_XS01G0209900 [Xanthoceras sorbifolium]